MLGSALLLSLMPAVLPAQQEEAPQADKPVVVAFGLHLRDFTTEKPVIGAQVQVKETPGKGRWEGVSNREGRVVFEGLPTGIEVEVTALHPVYAARQEHFTIRPFSVSKRIYMLRAASLECRLSCPPITPGARRELHFIPLPDTDTAALLEGEGYVIPLPPKGELPTLRICSGSYTVILREDGREICEWPFATSTRGGVQQVALECPSGPYRIEGLILDEAGRPHASARVRLVPLGRSGGHLLSTCDAEGRFALEQIPAGAYRVQAVRRIARNFFNAEELVMHTRTGDVLWGSRKVVLDAAHPLARVRFGYDEEAVNLTGILLLEGVPIAGWRVLLEDEKGENTWLSEYSRPDGMFEIPGLQRGGKYRVSYETPTAWAPAPQLEVGESEREVHYFAVSAFSLTGQVFLEDTRFSPEHGDIVIHAIDAPQPQWLGWLAPDGTFEIPSLHPGTYEMWIKAGGCQLARRTFTLQKDGKPTLDVSIKVARAKR